MRPALITPRRLVAALLVGAVALAAPGSARAAFVADSTVYIQNTGTSTSGIGTFTGTVSVDNVSKTSATVQVTLTNTNSLATGGYITGFAFNLPFGVTSANMTSAVPSTFTQVGGGAQDTLGNYDSVSGSPYGYFDVGAALGGDLLGGGSPTGGIGVGQTGTFTFSLTSAAGGYNLNTLTASNLISLLSANPQGGGAQELMVRFRGFLNGGSDKVIGGVICSPPPPPPPPPPPGVPAPPAVVLALAGFATCLLGRGFRRRLTAKAE
jgi:hypothetical protein